MRLCTFRDREEISAGVVLGTNVVSIPLLNKFAGTFFPNSVLEIIKSSQLAELGQTILRLGDRIERQADLADVRFACLYSNPPKIWGIGLNFEEHATDLAEKRPDEPASFMKPATVMIGPGEAVRLPGDSERVTGEAELAVVIGKRCKSVPRENVPSVIAGFLPAIDMTAEDILRRNPRFLTRAKSYDTFLSLGPILTTWDEIQSEEELRNIRVCTQLNGQTHRSNILANMRMDVLDLIAFHSRVFTWEPGDILLTGTPGAVVLSPGDRIGCEIEGFSSAENPVLGSRGEV